MVSSVLLHNTAKPNIAANPSAFRANHQQTTVGSEDLYFYFLHDNTSKHIWRWGLLLKHNDNRSYVDVYSDLIVEL